MSVKIHLKTLYKNYFRKLEFGHLMPVWSIKPPTKAKVRTGHGTTDWFQIGKGVCQGGILSPCLFNLYAEYIIRTLGWKKHTLELKLPREISITSDAGVQPWLDPGIPSGGRH